MRANERRMAIWNALQARRSDTIANLVTEFGVSERTIRYDIEELTLSYPIETVRGRHAGGVKVSDWYQPARRTLNPVQIEALQRLAAAASPDDRVALNSILLQFAS